jgi:hypothetical protein
MKISKKQNDYGLFENKVVHYALQLLALSLLLYFCFEIIKPFITLLIWGSVLAITFFPLHKKFTRLLKGRKWISASIITLIMFLLIIGPATMLTLATVDEFKVISNAYSEGKLQIPPPAENVKNWPVIGTALYNQWSEASVNLTGFITEHAETMKPIILKLIDLLSSVGIGILLLIASVLVAGIMMVYGKIGRRYGSQRCEGCNWSGIYTRNTGRDRAGAERGSVGRIVGFNWYGFMHCSNWNNACFTGSGYLYLDCRQYNYCNITNYLDAFHWNYRQHY